MVVIINVQRGSPSTGQPTMSAQADMMQVRWGSHGDYEPIALAPSSVQEFFDFTIKAFNLAEEYRVPVTVLADEVVGHMREKLIIPDDIEIVARKRPEKVDGQYLPFDAPCDGTTPMPAFGDGFNIHVTGLTHDERGYPDTNDPDTHHKLVERLCNKVLMHRKDICSVKKENCDDADIVINFLIENLRNNSVSDSHLEMRTDGTAGKNGSVFRFDRPDGHTRICGF